MIENMEYIQAKKGLGKIACYTAAEQKDISKFFTENRAELEEQVLKCGGVLLRGFNIRALSEFNKFSSLVAPELLDYVNRSTPRTKLGGKVYTATEYPPEKHIPFHNENAYTLAWPKKLLFFCVIAAQTGGETPIADSRQVFKRIDKKIIEEFNTKKVSYVRNFTQGIDLSWQEVFQTESKAEVERYCQENTIEYSWHHPSNNAVELITRQVCQATLKHPLTGEEVWFNQAHLFNVLALDEADRNVLISSLGKDSLPRSSYYGDGSEIQTEYFTQIKEAYEQERIEFPWQKGDVMILDNVLMAHARNPFTGDRKTVVAMGN